ncbi:hypothetical protein FQN57_005995 [Myotisia sp. PD_48]|nr:hypothetical protein FQN57_005995 [Myotisia sp. PD_48]
MKKARGTTGRARTFTVWPYPQYFAFVLRCLSNLVQGCWKCRARKVKCDEKKPVCSACHRLGLPCDSSSPRLVWVDDESKTYKSEGRRYLACEKTWGELPVLPSDVVDHLISQCDLEEVDNEFHEHKIAAFIPAHNPFNVFRRKQTQLSHRLRMASTPKLFIDVSPSFGTANASEMFLFHHYAHHVAFLMMPFEHPRNPWKHYYPAVAIHYESAEERALYSALLSHSAFNLAELGVNKNKNVALGIKYYNSAIAQLTKCFQSETRDFGGTIAAIMTLMMAELYSGQPRKWRYHFNGAWAFLREYEAAEPWKASELSCYSLQSLFILEIISDTCDTDRVKYHTSGDSRYGNIISSVIRQCTWSQSFDPDCLQVKASDEANVASSISLSCHFGFTIGAHGTVLGCISTISALGRDIRNDPEFTFGDERAASILSLIQSCEDRANFAAALTNNNLGQGAAAQSNSAHLIHYQLNAFISATYIFYYTTLFQVSPVEVVHYVSTVLENVLAFHKCCEGNFSIWPAFIAAVEAYTDEHVALARVWLDKATKFGIGNRNSMKMVVEGVWAKRNKTAEEYSIDPGLVAVDWRDVIGELSLDILPI